ncbi:MAG: hypothetical protein M3A44_07915 [Gammaproteobacteria bacterium]
MFIKKSLLIIAALFACLNAFAGSVEGPYIVWVNLSKEPSEVDNKIRNYLNHGDDLCWNNDALIFMRSRPPEISKELINSAIIKHETKAIAKLNRILKKPFGEANDGFDGIIVYGDQPKPKMYSLTTGLRQVKSESINSKKELEISLCILMPEIIRKP